VNNVSNHFKTFLYHDTHSESYSSTAPECDTKYLRIIRSEKNAMYRIRYRIRRVFLPPLLAGILITFTLIIINNNGSLLRQVFYNYQINFHGIPGSYLSTKTPNESYCNFRYGLPEELLYEESDLSFPFEEKDKSPYRILRDAVEAKWDKSVPEVTYATHATADFINYIPEIVR
jgi:hypothetical protein